MAIQTSIQHLLIMSPPSSRSPWRSAADHVSLNLELLDQLASFQNYVIAHKLLHLRIRNHGKLFAATLRAHLSGNPWIERAQ
ncbi:MAG: DUF45 domain-containing protein [Rhodanobacter sp.]|nr:MAG: DUF45 domain-containing protein [Rhodanobacter sp.]TAL91431.1 MAG: DUF45 domain-containing protein [Rhodanobacter sp.]TAM42134.1 MAG: DUF45 domain-containing protein [Rhodanobacter sp.]TAN26735.1 MAG: DUF45 domain-containing protein [Rhodanobacter sp.]